MDEETQPQHSNQRRGPSKTNRLNLRLTSEQHLLLTKASGIRGESVSNYVLRHGLMAAETDIIDRRAFFANDEQFEAIQAIVSAPSPVPDRLAELLKNPSRM